MRILLPASGLLAATLLAIAPAAGVAQGINPQGTPHFGTVNLRAGFTPDPHSVQIAAGGATRNPIEGPGCTGYLSSSAPDLRLEYVAGSLALTLSASATEDLSLLVQTPNGQWFCDDDSGEGLDPLLRFDTPASGTYNIWVATYSETEDLPDATLAISELGRSASAAVSLNWSAEPIFGTVTLRSGFTPDPHTTEVSAGGSDRNPIEGSGCTGYLTASAPDVKLEYTAGAFPLAISATSGTDVALVVRAPGGEWYCDDDSAEELDPLVTIAKPASGTYSVWVATFSSTSERPRSTVGFSEVGRNARQR